MTKLLPARVAARTGAALAVALAAASVVFAASPAIAAGSADPVNWGVRTADTDQGAGRSNYSYVLDPGTSLVDAIVVSNHDDTAVDLDLYAADGFTSESGQLDLVTRDTTSTAVGTWITLGEQRVHLEPGASVEVPFHVEVPANVMPGDYAGGVVTSLPAPEQSAGVSVDRRLGIRVQLRVGGELAPKLEIEDLKIDYDGAFSPFATGDATVTYTVRNTGNARLSAAQAVTVGGPFGLFAMTATDVSGALPDLLPGETRTGEATVPGVFAAGLLTATVALTPQFPSEGATTSGGVLPVVEASATLVAVPWSLVALLVLAGAAAAVVVLGRRRRARREAAKIEAAVAAALEARESEPVAAP